MALIRSSRLFWSSSCSLAAAAFLVAEAARAQENCFERIDNGVDMTGWRKSTTNPHGPGNGWTVEDGAFVGRQTEGQQGGILMTEKSYKDVEVVLDVKITWGCDSGLFFRTTDGSRAYQACIDHLSDSAVGGIWGESFPQELREIPYFLTSNGTAAIVAPNQSKTPIFDLTLWSTLWDPTAFNEMRARIEGNPPRLQVWVSGTKVMDFTDTMLRGDVAESGPLAIQVHGGSRWTSDGTVAFKNIRVRDLALECEDPGNGQGGGGAGGTGGMGTSGGGQTSGAGGVGAAGGTGGNVATSGLGGGGTGGDASGGTQPSGGQSGGSAPLGGQPPGGGTGGEGASFAGSGSAAIPSNGGDPATAGKGGSAAAPTERPPANDGDTGGCGCRVAPRKDRVGASLPLFLALAAWFARRARRSVR